MKKERAPQIFEIEQKIRDLLSQYDFSIHGSDLRPSTRETKPGFYDWVFLVEDRTENGNKN